MPNKLRKLKGREVIAILEKFGFEVARIRGSHHVMQRMIDEQSQTIIVPVHARKPLTPGTLKNIYRLATEYISEDDLRPHFYTD
jgi:predicted RNA binding protein YcfA (HicA-like mRNA interferase family)